MQRFGIYNYCSGSVDLSPVRGDEKILVISVKGEETEETSIEDLEKYIREEVGQDDLYQEGLRVMKCKEMFFNRSNAAFLRSPSLINICFSILIYLLNAVQCQLLIIFLFFLFDLNSFIYLEQVFLACSFLHISNTSWNLPSQLWAPWH